MGLTLPEAASLTLTALIIAVNYMIMGVDVIGSIALSTTIILALAILSSRRIHVIIRGFSMYINLGGFLIPLIYGVEVLIRICLMHANLSSILVLYVLLCSVALYCSSRYIIGHGIGVQVMVPMTLVSSSSIVLTRVIDMNILYAVPLATCAGMLSTIIGVDLVKAYRYARTYKTIFELGGNGIIDVNILSGILAGHTTLLLLAVAGYL